MKTFSINEISEFSKKDRIVVVGIIGKSALRCPNKATPLVSADGCEENGIQCNWDERASVLYLHATTYLDTNRLSELAANLDENSKATEKDADASDWLVASGELAAESCKIFALIFHLCHIVILSSPTPVFDTGYLQLFKAIDNYRSALSATTGEAIKLIGLGGNWETHGRTCCPRLLFHFRRAPRQLKRNPTALKRLEHEVEDQLYRILRKSRIITNVCAKSLFAIPKNEEFVYMSADEQTSNARDVSALIRGLVGLCSGEVPDPPNNERLTFKQFLNGHVELALAEGFDDNVGKYAMSTSFFELPSAADWRQAAQALTPIYLEQPIRTTDDDNSPSALYDALATDVRFSQARCAKVLPIAQASYAEGLPAHYSSQHHTHKVSVALGVLETMARGPLAAAARTRLRAACEATWRSRRLCEAPSLTAHPCREPRHDSTVEHSSGVRYISACSCGRTKCSREDPYSVERANHLFYVAAAEECAYCPTLQAVQFPLFKPSTPSFRAASVKGSSSQEAGDTRSRSPPSTQGSGAWSPDALSPGSRASDDESPPEREHSPADQPDQPDQPDRPDRPDQPDRPPVRSEAHLDKCIVRQPSTTEYLPGLLHTASPPGLLPAFPSWSLVCLGASSLYSHSLGLPEHLQPGLLPHTHHLTPWDANTTKVEQVSAWRVAQASARGRGSKPPAPHQLTVKIFIGFEYECPRGHRFMMSSPDTVVSGAASCTSQTGARLATTDMPLYAPCPCRGSKTMLAQLMRVHCVTPKAPVHVTLEPKVQPVAGGATFVPQPLGEPPIKLSASAYWVLRLPYIFASERGPLPRPAAPQTSGRILAPLFGVTD